MTNLPTTGGRYVRDPDTGALTPLTEDAVAPTTARLEEVAAPTPPATETPPTPPKKGAK